MQNFLLISSALIAVIAWWLAFSNAFTRPVTRANLAYAGFFCAAAVWATLYAVWQTADDPLSAQWWCRWLMVPAGFIGPFFFHWQVISSGMGSSFADRIVLPGLYVLAAVHGLLALFTSAVVAQVQPMFGVPFWPIAGWGFSLFLITYSVGFVWPCLRSLPDSSHVLARTVGGRHRVLGSVYVVASFCGATNIPGWFRIEIPPLGQPLIVPFLLMQAYIGTRRPGNVIAVDHAGTAMWVLVLFSIAALAGTAMQPLTGVLGNTPAAIAIVFVAAVSVRLLSPKLSWVASQMHLLVGGKAGPTRQLKAFNADMHAMPTPELLQQSAVRLGETTACQLVALYWRKGDHPLRLLASVEPRSEHPLPARLSEEEFVTAHSATAAEPWLPREAISTRHSWLDRVDVCVPVVDGARVELLLLFGEKQKDGRYTESEIGTLHTIAVNLHHTLTARALAEHEASQNQLIYTGKIAAGMAHNIRNPLGVIRAYLESDPSPPAGADRELHRLALAEVVRIQGTVDGLSALARGEQFVLASHDLHALVEHARDLQAEYLSDCGAELVLTFGPDRYHVLADRNQLINAISNLLRNAAEEIATLQRPGRIDCAATFDAAGFVTLTLKDTGRGLPPHIEQAIFSRDLFAKTTKPHHAPNRRTGYGIGLHSTMLIVTIGHGGTFAYRDGTFFVRLRQASNA